MSNRKAKTLSGSDERREPQMAAVGSCGLRQVNPLKGRAAQGVPSLCPERSALMYRPRESDLRMMSLEHFGLSALWVKKLGLE